MPSLLKIASFLIFGLFASSTHLASASLLVRSFTATYFGGATLSGTYAYDDASLDPTQVVALSSPVFNGVLFPSPNPVPPVQASLITVETSDGAPLSWQFYAVDGALLVLADQVLLIEAAGTESHMDLFKTAVSSPVTPTLVPEPTSISTWTVLTALGCTGSWLSRRRKPRC